MTTEFTIHPDDPFFAGHFPGRPVFPGVGQLALVAACARGGGSGVSGIEQVRFRRPLAPADRVEVVFDAGASRPGDPGGSRRRFELRVGVQVATSGVLRFAPEEAAGAPVVPLGDASPPAPIAGLQDLPALNSESLVPHRPPALLLESLDAAGPAGARASARIPSGSPYRQRGLAPGFLALEIASQAAAALETYLRSAGGGAPDTRPGFLVSARDVECVTWLPEGTIRVSLEAEGGSPPLALYRFRITRDEGERGTLARGRIGTWIQEGPAQAS